ncbi:MAG: substrate-binding domain-containing protein, partial [Pseudomonadota bacterium]
MIKNIRHKRILAVLENEGAIETRSLATRIPGVSEVTLRRDIVELAEAGALRRTRGGALPASGYGSASGLHDVKAQRFERTESTSADGGAFHDNVDAIILPYVAGRDGDMLRRRILQRGIPFLAESTPQPGGVYLGPDNRAAAHALGVLAATYLEKRDHLRLLIIGQSELSNTTDRVTGFLDGVRHERTTKIDVTQVEGHGSYRIALQAALDAFADNETFDAVFAVNDHSAVAALEAAETIGERPMVFSTGGESAEFIAKVCDDESPLTAVAAFFPEVVGSIAVDAIAAALQDEGMADRIVTPHALITEHTLSTYYEDGPSGWALRDERLIELSGRTIEPSPSRDRKVIGFMPHYPAHDWYRAMAQTLEDRASRYGHTIAVAPPHQGIADETSRLRREIASVASDMVHPGETIVMGAGEATDHMADLIARTAHASPRRYKDLTVITNALDILYRLDDAPGIKTILTSGEYQASDKC